MKLKQLEIHGFKSFNDRTVVNFDRRITGVVGPNGCGKSNIVDAIRWVMGEQSAKHLRGRSMEDIIFSGTQSRQPNSLASVELTFESEGDLPPQFAHCSEISIGRKLYRTGESEYFINKQSVRLKDVTDFFLGTGIGAKAYSIIEQGRVGQIVSMKPEERRSIIEEAAGISKFKARKESAVRRIESTRGNLSRLVDVLSEIDRQKASLERQAKKAVRYQELKDELTQVDHHLITLSLQDLRVRESHEMNLLDEESQNLTQIEAKMSTVENTIETERLAMNEIEPAVQKANQEVYQADNDLRLAESHLRGLRDTIDKLQNGLKAQEMRMTTLQNEMRVDQEQFKKALEESVTLEMDLSQAEIEFAESSASLSGFETEIKTLLDELTLKRQEFQTLNSSLARLTTQIEHQESFVNNLQSNKERDAVELQELTQRSSDLEKGVSQAKEDLSRVKQLRLDLGVKCQSIEESLKQEQTLLNNERQILDELKSQLMQKKSRLESLRELERNFEGYNEGTRHILKKKSQNEWSDVLGVVADIIEPNSTYETAVSAVLGDKLQGMIVPEHEASVACAGYLKQNVVGRGTFIAMKNDSEWVARTLEKTYTQEEKPQFNGEGWVGLLKDIVTVKSGYEGLKTALFGNTAVTKTMSNALEYWTQTHQPVVTLEGEYLSAEGIFSGGVPENTTRALLEKKREIHELVNVVQMIVDQVKEREETCLDLNRKIQSLKAQIDELKTTTHDEELRMARQEKDLGHFQREVEHLLRQRDKVSARLLTVEEQIETAKRSLETQIPERGILSERVTALRLWLEENSLKESEARQKLADMTQRKSSYQIKLARGKERLTSLEREENRLTQSRLKKSQDLCQLSLKCVRDAQYASFLRERISFAEKNIQRLLNAKQEKQDIYQNIRNDYDAKVTLLNESERDLKGIRHDADKTRQSVNRATVALTELRGDLTRLSEQLLERYQMTFMDLAEHIVPEDFVQSEGQARATELRQKIASLGQVNLEAIEELKTLTERHQFLVTQKADLEESLLALERAIQKINKTTRERFKITFEAVNEKFKKLFPRSFNGGSAYLELTDPENLLETGVEIIAQPPGKKLQSISLLSGGEKALTAVSLLFAIFLIKPAPFCLLDEVDAPLDDANVDRYNEIVSEMSHLTQFIVITHNKRTMQMTEALFGVTMQEPGVSRVVSVNLSA